MFALRCGFQLLIVKYVGVSMDRGQEIRKDPRNRKIAFGLG